MVKQYIHCKDVTSGKSNLYIARMVHVVKQFQMLYYINWFSLVLTYKIVEDSVMMEQETCLVKIKVL